MDYDHISALLFYIDTTCTAEDAYVIGRESYHQQHWEHSRQWMREALDRFDNGEHLSCSYASGIQYIVCLTAKELGSS